jgi:hypothetical protein
LTNNREQPGGADTTRTPPEKALLANSRAARCRYVDARTTRTGALSTWLSGVTLRSFPDLNGTGSGGREGRKLLTESLRRAATTRKVVVRQ